MIAAEWSPRRTVALTLDLPQDLAEEVERLQDRDPELLERMFYYAALRVAVLDGLKKSGGAWNLQKNT